MEYCAYCQRWVEPGGWLGGVVGTDQYLHKSSRCPICNIALASQGRPRYLPQRTQTYPQLVYSQYPQLGHQYPQPQQAYLPPAPQYPATPAPTAYPQVTRAIPVPQSQHCPHCRRPITYSTNLQQWYCYFCQRPIQ